MPPPWYRPLRPVCMRALNAARRAVPPAETIEVPMPEEETVRFYLARWCQKTTRTAEPDVSALGKARLRRAADDIVRNLIDSGARVDGLFAGNGDLMDELLRELRSSALRLLGREAAEAADQYSQEALQKILEVLLTGTPPSRVTERLAESVDGRANEYVFKSPFSGWARRIVINMIIDELRKRFHGPGDGPALAAAVQRTPGTDDAVLRCAIAELPRLLDAIRDLPPRQREVMVWTLVRSDLHPRTVKHLRKLAPDLFAVTEGHTVSSDRDIAVHIYGVTQLDDAQLDRMAHRVAANRSEARRKLAARNPLWRLLLDAFMPHHEPLFGDMDDDDPEWEEPHG